eukprot:m.233056 g.233056  ORF g.233056 m.233056 type:complete len:297 (+) comp15242_c1_seq1:208-1098(+)
MSLSSFTGQRMSDPGLILPHLQSQQPQSHTAPTSPTPQVFQHQRTSTRRHRPSKPSSAPATRAPSTTHSADHTLYDSDSDLEAEGEGEFDSGIASASVTASALSAFHSGMMDDDTQVVSLRVYGGEAIVSPGSEYKSVHATTGTTAREVIERVLERYGEQGDTEMYELRFVRIDSKTGKVKKQGSLTRLLSGSSSDKQDLILQPDFCPVLFAEWYGSKPRRFVLHRRASPSMLATPASSLNPAAYASSAGSTSSSASSSRLQSRQGSKPGSKAGLFASLRHRTSSDHFSYASSTVQ